MSNLYSIIFWPIRDILKNLRQNNSMRYCVKKLCFLLDIENMLDEDRLYNFCKTKVVDVKTNKARCE